MRRPCLFLPALLGFWMLLCPANSVRAQAPVQERDRLVVALIELAFLNDPGLCSYYPCARVEGNTVTLEGYLPDSTLKNRAEQLALLVSRMNVANEIKIHPGCRLIPAVIPNDLLLKNAALAVKTRFPQDYKNWQMGLRSTGELVVSGAVDSHDKKLQVSQKLRGLPGCKCVVNMLQVHYGNVPVVTQNHPVASHPIQPVGGIQSPSPYAPIVPANPGLKPMPGNPPSGMAAIPMPMPVGPKVQAGTMVQPISGNNTTTQKIESVTVTTRPDGYDGKGTMLLPPGHPDATRITPNKVIWQSEQGSFPYQKVPSNPNTTTQKPSGGSYPTPYATVSKQQPMPVMAISQAPMTPAAPKILATSATQVPSLAIPPNSGKGNTPGTVAIAVNRPATKPLGPSEGKSTGKLVELQKTIEMAGGGKLTSLKLDLTGNHLTVRFFVPDETQADRLADLITALPQLDGYQLKLFIDVPE